MNRLLLLLVLLPVLAWGYQLTPREVARGVYVFEGRAEHFSRENRGDIVNTGFIVTGDGVVVFDTGPSRNYGRSMRLAIRMVTDEPIVAVFISHHHPDHFLGNQAFEDVPIHALEHTMEVIRRDGDAVTDNLYRLVGTPMAGTEPLVPDRLVTLGRSRVGDRELELIAVGGHAGQEYSDLMLLDHTTGVLFAGDVVFHQRAPTTPSADTDAWLAALDTVEALDFRVLVPGHGPVSPGPEAIAQTRDYLSWLETHLRQAAGRGLDAAEVMYLPVPERFRRMGAVVEEYQRSVSHLYPVIERDTMPVTEAP